jgi:hypothetical protein
VRACGLPPSALSLLGNFDPAGSDKYWSQFSFFFAIIPVTNYVML